MHFTVCHMIPYDLAFCFPRIIAIISLQTDASFPEPVCKCMKRGGKQCTLILYSLDECHYGYKNEIFFQISIQEISRVPI